MEKIRFIKEQDKVYDGSLNVFGNRLSVVFHEDVPGKDVLLSGFELLNEHNGRVQGEYLDFNTIYREYEDNEKMFELSNDGSVYVPYVYVPTVTFRKNFGGEIEGELTQQVNNYEELVIPTVTADENYKFIGWSPEIPESGEIESDVRFYATFEYVPTEEELQAIFENNKANKILESKAMLETYLEENPLKSICHNGVEGTYTITSEKQTLMSNNYLTYMIAKQSGLEAELTWNESGKECEVWTEAEFLQLVIEVQSFVKPLVSLQQKYEVLINACETQEELDAIAIVYGE